MGCLNSKVTEQRQYLTSDNSPLYNILICGAIGQGKSTFVNTVDYNCSIPLKKEQFSVAETGTSENGTTKTLMRYRPTGCNFYLYDMYGITVDNLVHLPMIVDGCQEINGKLCTAPERHIECAIVCLNSSEVTSNTLDLTQQLIQRLIALKVPGIVVFTHDFLSQKQLMTSDYPTFSYACNQVLDIMVSAVSLAKSFRSSQKR